eukprot:scaffold275923_cov46-Prasinocladus_malaysianus.AAC.1
MAKQEIKWLSATVKRIRDAPIGEAVALFSANVADWKQRSSGSTQVDFDDKVGDMHGPQLSCI